MSEPEHSTPEYGQYQKPAYGAMSGQYGPNYNPYIYGAPEPDANNGSAADNNGAGAGQPNNGRPSSSGNSFGGNQQYGQSQQPHYYNGIDRSKHVPRCRGRRLCARPESRRPTARPPSSPSPARRSVVCPYLKLFSNRIRHGIWSTSVWTQMPCQDGLCAKAYL